jgi:hypothetical protein
VAVLPELVTRVTAVATTPLGYIHITIWAYLRNAWSY